VPEIFRVKKGRESLSFFIDCKIDSNFNLKENRYIKDQLIDSKINIWRDIHRCVKSKSRLFKKLIKQH